MSIRLKTCSLLALAAGALLINAAPASAAGAIYGAGATLPFNLYRAATGTSSWFDNFAGVGFTSCNPASANCIAFASLGSGAGLTAFLAQQSPNATPALLPYESSFIAYAEGTNGYGAGSAFFDFAASDAILTAAQVSQYTSTVQPTRGAGIQIPTVGSPVAIAFNATGLTINHAVPSGTKATTGGSSGLWLSRRAYCGIFTGAITNWNDPILTADNGGVALTSSLPIKVYRRADSSGTTFLFSRHLATVCNGTADKTTSHAAGNLATWTATNVGTTVTWPAAFTAATGSDGVAKAVAATSGAIGYVSPDYTQQSTTPAISPAPVAANLQNQFDYNNGGPISGDTPRPPAPTYTTAATASFIVPSTNTQAAWGTAADTAAMRNPTGSTAYPAAGFTLVNLYGCYASAAKVTALKAFVAGYTAGGTYDTLARNSAFAPLPSTVKTAANSWVSTGITTCP
ncbi:MAG: substrate-binding domain-containing protein [Inquilinus limosus]|uniref:Substrate-binding domain-containing protein n=1 Tax=Inquilinus limosus TaxID=171674 RepID=A0A952FHF3_9PROT|nr:substrate-binding domain-containing protein [Inquilinus limosus]